MKILGLIGMFMLAAVAHGQYYYLEGSGDTPGGLNQDEAFPEGSGQASGWTEILGPSLSTPTWSGTESIPFAFDFDGAAVTNFKVSSTGVLTFTTGAVAVPAETNLALPDASIPDNSICIWGLMLDGSNDHVSTKTFGSAPNRQHWIHWSSCSNGALAWSYWSIVLEETTNKIYLVDQRHSASGGSLTAGIQINTGEAYSVAGSPNLTTQAGSNSESVDDFYYEFIYGTLPATEIVLQDFDILPYIGTGATNISGTFVNQGASTITDVTVTWDDGTGPYVDNLSGLNVQTNDTYYFTHATQLSPTAGQAYTITLSVDVTGDVNTGNNSIQESTVSLTTIPTKYVVGEEKTGTWCGWCPRGAVGMAGMESEPRFIGIAVHNNDPMEVSSYDNNIGTYVPGGYPRGGVDRVEDGNPINFDQMFANRETEVVPCAVNSITMVHNAGSNSIEVDCEVEFYGNIAGDYRLSAVLVEDNVMGDGTAQWDQVNYYDGDGAGAMTDPVTGFEWGLAGDPVNPLDFGGYDHVAVALSNNAILGNTGSLPAGTVPAGTYTYSFTDFPDNLLEDIDEAHVVVMVVNANTGEILNAGKTGFTNVGIEEAANNYELSLYPNPASESVNIVFTLDNTSQVAVTITNMLGQVVMNTGETTRDAGKNLLTVEASDLPSGIYFVNLKVGNEIVTQKLIVH